MVIDYDTRPNATVDEKLRSLIDSIMLALGEIGIQEDRSLTARNKEVAAIYALVNGLSEAIDTLNDTALLESDKGVAGGVCPLNTSSKVGAEYLDGARIPFGQVDDTSTATEYTATVPGITELEDGVCLYLMNGVVTSAAGFTIDVNGLGAKPVYQTMAAASRITTLFNINYTWFLVYNSQRVEGGCWDAYYGYDSNTNTIGYQLRTNSMSLPMSSVTYRYRLLFTSADGTKFVPANNSTSTNATSSRTVCQDKIDPFGDIRYYGTTASVAANSRPGTGYLWGQYNITLGYSFNRTGAALTLTSWKPVYLKCAPQSDGSAIMDSSTPIVQALPSSEDGNIYIFLGVATSATTMELMPHHPVYEYKGGKIRPYTNTLPTAPTTDGTYVLTVTVTGGTPVYTWE